MSKNIDIKYHILGINKDIPKWNFDFYKEISFCKMALNLSRGKPLKYATSNRIASQFLFLSNMKHELGVDLPRFTPFFYGQISG